MTAERNIGRLSGFISLLGLVFLLLPAAGCRQEETWNPEIIALVNGRPIPKAEIDRVLELGFYPELDQGGERELTIPMILIRLIDEELVLEQAAKTGIIASEAEMLAAMDRLGGAWFGIDPPPAELDELRQALRKYTILRKMTEKIMVEERQLTAAGWREFWEQWPKQRIPDFLVRAILLPPTDNPPFVAEDYSESLEKLAEDFKLDGVAALVSQPLKLAGNKLDPAVAAALSDAFSKKRLSAPVRLDESWAVYEILEMGPEHTPEEEFEAARQAFEAREGEKAFRQWLANIRGRADIRLNPAYQAQPPDEGSQGNP